MTDKVDYALLAEQARALLGGQKHLVANAANLTALIYQELPDLNWVGFYFLEDGQLMLGPFQGRPACVQIPVGKGVCGTAAATARAQRVDDVHAFDGHIACDAASASELVVPLVSAGEVFGVLDLDSPSRGRFSEHDEAGISRLAEVFTQSVR